MKKVILTLAVLVMAFGNVGLAQSKADLKAKTTKMVFKQYGLVRDSDIVPQEANYSEVDGTQHRTTYYYDESEYYLNEEIMETYYEYWVNESRAVYEYDFYGNVIEALVQEWDEDDWADLMKATYTYDGEIISEVVYQYYVNGMWMNTAREVYNFNGDTWTVLYWIWNGTTWSSDLLYTYTRSGNTIELLMQYMEGGAWQNEEKQLFTLDFDENITEIVTQEWENNAWVNYEQTTYLYNDGIYTDKYIKEWTGSAWGDSYHFTYEYDVYGNAKHGECYGFMDNEWAPADYDIEIPYDYSAEQVTYYGTRVDVTYVDLTAASENAQAQFNVYPVPAENEIQIQAEGFLKVEIFTLTGQMLMESEQNSMDVRGLASGVYLLKVYDKTGNSATRKLVVK